MTSGHLAARLIAATTVLGLGAPINQAAQIETITVIAKTPVGRGDLDVHDYPGGIQTAGQEQLAASGSLDVSGYLARRGRGVHVNSAQGNPLQSDLYYRGYAASPLLGLPMGLTVYQNGVRLNEPLGDAVNWDLVPMKAIAELSVLGGSNPLFGLNTLGGSIVMRMKDGFSHGGHALEVESGSHDRLVTNLESGGNDGRLGYYVNGQRFDEDGWRDLSPSRAQIVYGNVDWRAGGRSLAVEHHRADSKLTGNGLSPAGLLARDRAAVFTAPDITENSARMWSLGGGSSRADGGSFIGKFHVRDTDTASINGDALEEDDVDDLIDGFGGQSILSPLLSAACAGEAGEPPDAGDDGNAPDEAFEETVGEGGCGAVNNISRRSQNSRGGVIEFDLPAVWFGYDHDLSAGGGFYRGRSAFESRVQFALFDPATRSTRTPGSAQGGFADEATDIGARVERRFLYVGDSIDVGDAWIVTLSGFLHQSEVDLRDQTGEQPQLNGSHRYRNFNWRVGGMRRWATRSVYASIGRSSRLPTPIELACSEALARNPETGEVEECRLPNAFLADPPLEEVIAKSIEFGIRGDPESGLGWSLNVFHVVNDDDIIWQTGQTRAHGLFRNVAGTRRMGAEMSLQGTRDRWDWSIDYTHVRATFADSFAVLSPNHPANAGGDDEDDDAPLTRPVSHGDRIPGIPGHVFKAAADYAFTDRLSLGVDMVAVSGSHLRGDESNELDELAGHAVVNAVLRYRNDRFEASLLVENILGSDYENFGLIGEEPDDIVGLNDIGDDVRFLAPGAPRSAWLRVRLAF